MKDGQSTILIQVSKKAEFSGATVLQRDENNGDHRCRYASGRIQELCGPPHSRFADDARRGSEGYNLREWHAKGVGPVKVVGELSWVTPGKPNRGF